MDFIEQLDNDNIYYEVMNISRKLDKHYEKEVLPKLSDNMKYVLKEYTGSYYHDITHYLLSHNSKDAKYEKDIALLSSAIKLSRLPFPLTVYRGDSFGNFQNISTHNNNEFTTNIFYSTSINPLIANDFKDRELKGLILEINLPAGYPALWMEPLSLINSESELLILPNSSFKTLSLTKHFDNTNNLYSLIKAVPCVK